MENIVCTLERGLCFALMGKRPPIWARHRWTGADLCLQELGLLECIHHLLSRTYARFLVALKDSKVGNPIDLGAEREPKGADSVSHAVAASEVEHVLGDEPVAGASVGGTLDMDVEGGIAS
eukprot:4154427-Amphidinium_carterae.1